MDFHVVFSMRDTTTDRRWEWTKVVEAGHWWSALIEAKKDMEWGLRRVRNKTKNEVMGVYVQPV